ncbi:MAG: hypothetical protein ACE5F7_11550, partial [Nitrospiria bacterium]
MMKNFMTGAFLLFSFVGLVSCGRSGGGAVERPASTVEGFAVDAQIAGGDVTVYSYKNGVKGEVLGTATTDEKGFYSIKLSASDQYILIEVRGGSYVEEASGENVSLAPGQLLRAITFYKSGSPVRLMVTPFTNVAAGLAEYKIKGGVPIENAVTEASTAITSMVGVDILTVVPANITDLANADRQFTPELKYGFMAAAISSWTKEASALNGSEVHSIWNSIAFAQVMYRDISEDGRLDGKGIDPETQQVVDLGLGLVLIDANTYRAELAKHLMMMIGSDVNKVGITFAQAVPEADRLGGMTHTMFGGLEPVVFDGAGPVITPTEAEGLYHNDVFNFSVTVTDIVGIKSVVFDIDGGEIGQAADPANPSFPINTKLYSDGEYHVGVRAFDNLGNESHRSFRINFVNNGSSVNLLSPTLVNSSPVALFGNYIDNGTGVQSILVNGVVADIDIESRTWSVNIPLTDLTSPLAFVKEVPLVITDGLGVQNSELITITVDAIPPAFDPVPQYSDATFVNGGTTFRDKLSF